MSIGVLQAEAPSGMLVVPVPLHRSKLALRGFNQARALAVEAIRTLKRTHPDWQLQLASSTLMRLRPTLAQAGLTPHQRRVNLRGAFSVTDPAAILGRHVLLVDDILTTGATARAAARELTQAGAAGVWVAVLARARRLSDTTQDLKADQAAWGAAGDSPGPQARPQAAHDLPDATHTFTQAERAVFDSSHDQRSF